MMFPTYNATMNNASVPAKYVTMKEDNGLTYAQHLPVLSRKRSREDSNNSITMNHHFVPFAAENLNNNHSSTGGSFAFLGEDFSSHQIHQDQLEFDRFIAHHLENVRMEMEEHRRKCARIMMVGLEDSIAKKLRSKEEELEKIGKLNLALVDRVKSLYVENQMWRDLAQTNEATATALQNHLEQVLAHVQDNDHHQHGGTNGGVGELLDDAQSCRGSNCNEDVEIRMLAHHNSNVDTCTFADNSIRSMCTLVDNTVVVSNCGVTNGKVNCKMCRSCGKEEACVLLLPCRHLCLCSGCGSYLHICPVCKSSKSCSLHVNLST